MITFMLYRHVGLYTYYYLHTVYILSFSYINEQENSLDNGIKMNMCP